MSTVVKYFIFISYSTYNIVLVGNPSNSELININYSEHDFPTIMQDVQNFITGAIEMQAEDQITLSSSMKSTGVRRCLELSCSQLDILALRLKRIKLHQWLFLLKNTFAAPRCISRIRFVPCFQHSNQHRQFVLTLRKLIAKLCSVTVDDVDWTLAKIPMICSFWPSIEIWPRSPSL